MYVCMCVCVYVYVCVCVYVCMYFKNVASDQINDMAVGQSFVTIDQLIKNMK